MKTFLVEKQFLPVDFIARKSLCTLAIALPSTSTAAVCAHNTHTIRARHSAKMLRWSISLWVHTFLFYLYHRNMPSINRMGENSNDGTQIFRQIWYWSIEVLCVAISFNFSNHGFIKKFFPEHNEHFRKKWKKKNCGIFLIGAWGLSRLFSSFCPCFLSLSILDACLMLIHDRGVFAVPWTIHI